jgi:Ca-activated chloride channel family protein
LFGTAAFGQSAEDYFHRGAQLYIANKKSDSKQTVEAGLRVYPQDPLLNGMAGLLKKEEEQQQQQGQDEQQKDQKKEDQSSQQKQEKQEQQSAQDQQQQQQQGQKDSQPQPQQGQPEQQPGEQQSGSENQPTEQSDQNATAAPGQMTPQQARQLLDTQKQDEKALPVSPANNKEGAPRNRPVKDW